MSIYRITLLVLISLALCETEVAAQIDALPKVRLLATGGTIAKGPNNRITAQELVSSVSSLPLYVPAETEQFLNLQSSDLTTRDWISLSRRINQLFQNRKDLSGIVVSSGTDTLEEIAYFLNLTVKYQRPVVVVGAMRPPTAEGYDGSANLLQAFRVAADPNSIGRGVLVVLNSEINSAREVTKSHTQQLNAFQSRGSGILGVTNFDRIVYYGQPSREHTVQTEFDISKTETLPRVDTLLSYQDAPGDLILAAVEAGAAGIVIAASGAGAMSPDQRTAINQIMKKGIPVVISSRTGGGHVALGRNVAKSNSVQVNNPLRIAAEDLSPIKSRILLMLALTVTKEGTAIQKIFEKY